MTEDSVIKAAPHTIHLAFEANPPEDMVDSGVSHHIIPDEALRLESDARCQNWNAGQIHDLIRDDFDLEVLRTFEGLDSGRLKNDLARFCILYRWGGTCIDPMIRMLAKWAPPSRYGIAAFSLANHPGREWTEVHTDLLWSRPGRKEWELAIGALARCVARGISPQHRTLSGGVLLGRALGATMATSPHQSDIEDQWIGEVRAVIARKDNQTLAFVAPDRSLVALLESPGD